MAIREARRAGIRVLMITGDHPRTAARIAADLGIVDAGGSALTGLELDALDGTAFAEAVRQTSVYARVSPAHKLRIVDALQADGNIVAMTGDGVNDAPALKSADIGIAMGVTGTEVTKEAAKMILADDNFATIVEAVREGRGIFDNIRKTLVYLLSGNTGELTVMLVAALGGLPLPLLPLHLLWINVVTDGLPALALVVDPAEDDVLQRPPRHPDEPMLGRAEWWFIITTGLLQGAATLGVFVWALSARDLSEARNLAFSVLVFGELFRAFAARSTTRVFWEVGAFTNVRLLAVVVFSVLMQLGIHHIPAAQAVFEIGPLSAADCLLTLLVASGPVTVIEVGKLVRRWNVRKTLDTRAQ
jgi:Ca2+-transporting ATPase